MLKDVTKKELAKDACKIDLMRRIPRYIIYLVMIAICSICANTFDTAVVKTLMMAFIMLFIFFILFSIFGHKAFVDLIEENEYEILKHKFDGVWWYCLRFKGAKIDDFFRIEKIEDKEV